MDSLYILPEGGVLLTTTEISLEIFVHLMEYFFSFYLCHDSLDMQLLTISDLN